MTPENIQIYQASGQLTSMEFLAGVLTGRNLFKYPNPINP
jgi:hypothetical protein